MKINEFETIKRTYYFLKSYQTLLKLANMEETNGAFKKKAIEIVNIVDRYKDSLNEEKREVFSNLFTRPQKEVIKLSDLYKLLNIDKDKYRDIKNEIIIDFARSYREGALLVFE